MNIYDAAKYGIENNLVKNRVDVESTITIKIIDEDLKKELRGKWLRMFMMLP